MQDSSRSHGCVGRNVEASFGSSHPLNQSSVCLEVCVCGLLWRSEPMIRWRAIHPWNDAAGVWTHSFRVFVFHIHFLSSMVFGIKIMRVHLERSKIGGTLWSQSKKKRRVEFISQEHGPHRRSHGRMDEWLNGWMNGIFLLFSPSVLLFPFCLFISLSLCFFSRLVCARTKANVRNWN